MTPSVFAYPGNKAQQADWIIEHLPAHRTYVEPFGGAAGVLANKSPSHVEVYNDRDADLVQFFHVLQQRGDDLRERLTPPLYNEHDAREWGRRWDEGWRPDDAVERAAVFFYLRCTSWGGKYRYYGGFSVSTVRNQARTYANQVDRLAMFAERFREVVVTQSDWAACLDRWDDPETVFYCDPPYPDARPRYRHGDDFDHAAFAERLAALEGRWVASYGPAVPAPVRDLAAVIDSRKTAYEMGAGANGPADATTHHLLCSFDPAAVEPFASRQSSVREFSPGDSA